MIEHLMSSALSGDHQGCAAGLIWLHVRGLHFSSTTNRASVGCEWAGGTARSSIEFGISRVTGSDEREKGPINDLFYVKRRQRLLQYEQLIAYEGERRC